MTDSVNHPSHYAEGWSNGAEIIHITENLSFNRGNAVKYIARAGKKNKAKELEDLLKAEFYLKREIERLQVVDLDEPLFEHMAQPVQPRVWDSISDVPADVQVEGLLGSRWVGRDYGWLAAGLDIFAPFTEVIEGTHE